MQIPERIHLTVDHNFNFSLPGVLPFLATIQRTLMALQETVDALTAQNATLTTAIDQAAAASALTNDKADALILAHNVMADDLAALRGQIANQVSPATLAQLDTILANGAAAITKAQAITAAAVEQGAQNDQAAAIVA